MTVYFFKHQIIVTFVSSQERFGSIRKNKLRPAEDGARHPDRQHPRAHAAGRQRRVQDQRGHPQGLQQDDEQGLPLAKSPAALPSHLHSLYLEASNPTIALHD